MFLACLMDTEIPRPPLRPACRTVPSAVETMGVPASAAKSVPRCARYRWRTGWKRRRWKPEEIRRSETLDQLLATDEVSFLINGHMHFRMLIDFERMTLMNAGTLMGHYAGVSIVDFETDALTVYAVDDERPPAVLLQRRLSRGTDRPIWRNTAMFDGTRTPVTLYADG